MLTWVLIIAILAFAYMMLRDVVSRGQRRTDQRRWLPRHIDERDDDERDDDERVADEANEVDRDDP